MPFGLPISSSELLTYGGVGYTLGTLLHQGSIAKLSSYAIIIGGVFWIIEQLGISL